MMSKILFTPRPLPEESPTSILKRMAIRHGCILRSDLKSLFGRAYFNGSVISRSHPIIQEISKRTGPTGDDFLSGFYEPIGALHHAPPLKIAGLAVNADMIRKREAAYCSECSRNGHEYFIKDLKLSSYCPFHLRKYLSRCPNCQAKIYWHVLDEKCRCNHLLVSPPCSTEAATNEQKLLNIFRAGDAEKFCQLLGYLDDVGYRVERDTECPANRCLLTIAFALLEDDMVGVLANLRKLKSLYPEVPAFIISAKLSLISYIKVRDCVREFIKQSSQEHAQEDGTLSTAPLHSFSLTKSQIVAWLNMRLHHWSTLRLGTSINPDKNRYNWQQAQTISKQVLIMKLRNDFSRKKGNTENPPKNLQEKLQLSADAIKGAIELHLLTPKWGKNRRMYFDPHDVETFSQQFISVKLLSSQTKTPTKQIRTAIAHLKIATLNLANSILRRKLISTQASQSVIEWCNDFERQRRKLIIASASHTRHDPAEGKILLPIAAAAEYLETWAHGVRHLIKIGLLTKLRKPQNRGYFIDISALKCFKAQYVSGAEASKLLGCNRAQSAKILRRLGVSPIMGPGVDHSPANFYLREKILQQTKMGNRLFKENANGYTIRQASEKLQIPTEAILNMITAGALQLSDANPKAEPIIKFSSIETFYKHYAKSSSVARGLKTHTPFVYKILSGFGIYPVSGKSTDASSQLIYAIDDLANYFSIPDPQKSHQPGQELELALINVTDLWKKYDIGGTSFGRLFLNSGFTKPVRIGATTYLFKDDASKAEEILKKYCTLAQADRYLGHKHTKNLTTRNKLSVHYPLIDYLNYPMIDKIQLEEYATKHGFV